MKFAVFTVSMPDYNPMEALDKLKEFGYDGAEWRCTQDKGDPAKPGFWSGNRTTMTAQQLIDRAAELKRECGRRGLEMPSVAGYIDCYDLAVVELHLQATAAIGAKTVRIGAGRYQKDGQPYALKFRKAREQFAKVADLAKKHGVRAAIETHPGVLTPSVASIRAVLEGLDPRHVGIIWDPANEAVEGGEIPEMALDIAGEYLAEVHAKNNRWVAAGQKDGYTQWKNEPCPIREGQVDWAAVMALLKNVGYDGWIAFEDFSTTHPLDERLRDNINFLRGLMK
jgi:sugar phosphate isomerase/epimerase